MEKILWQWFFSSEEGRVWGKIEKMWKGEVGAKMRKSREERKGEKFM